MTLTNDEGDELLVEDVWEDVWEELSDHHISLHSFDFTGVPTGVLFPLSWHFDIDGLEGITTDNQLVKVDCKDNGKTILTINK